MTDRVFFCTPRWIRAAIVALLFCAPQMVLVGQSPQQAYEQAYAVYDGGDFAGAAEAFARFLEDYPTSPQVFPAQLQLAYSLYFNGEYAEAEKAIQPLFGNPPPPEELKERASAFLPQILSAKAAEEPEESAQRNAGFEAAVAKFTEFLTNYPQSKQVETVRFGRALANLQLKDYAAAIQDLEANLQQFPNSPSVLESQNLLALVLATQAGKVFAEGNREQAIQLLDRSADLLRDIVNRDTDLALANTANFQLGEILLNRAGQASGEQRQQSLDQARQAFRRVLPNEKLVAEQERRIEDFRNQIRQALAAGNSAQVTQLREDREREIRKLGELKSRDNQVPTASLKVGEVYFSEGDQNAARTLIDRVEPFLEKENDKKRAAYFRAMTYALQGATERAVQSYNAFQSNYKGDPLASNLPVTMGRMFVDAQQPEEAIRYLNESTTLYPDSDFAGLSTVLKGTALSQLGRNEEALAAYQEYLSNPEIEPETGMVAQKGMADLYKNLSRWDEAIAAYRKVVSDYPQFEPQVEESEFWIAVATQQKGANADSIPLLDAFIKKYPDSELMPMALYSLSAAQLGTNRTAEAMKTMEKLAEEHPDSQPATFTYFQRAQIYGSNGEVEKVQELMQQFVEKYPDDEKVWFAYDSLGQTAVNQGDLAAAAENYLAFANKYPQRPEAPGALIKASNAQRSQALGIARNAAALPDDEKKLWKGHVDDSIESLEQVVDQHPDSPEVAAAFEGILDSLRLMLAGELIEEDDITAYYEGKAKESPSQAVQSKALFTLAGFIAEQDEKEALAVMERAYDPAFRYSAANLDTYGLALVREGRYDDAEAVFEKVRTDYPNPADVEPTQAPLEIQQAQSIAMFGLARIAQEQGKTAAAGKMFEELKKLYPWSPKVLEADLGIAEALAESGKLDEALDLANQITRNPNATADIRAKSLFLGGEVMEKKNDKAAAADYYLKVFQYYPGVPQVAAESLWRGGQLLEQVAAGEQDPARKAKQIRNARRSYDDILTNFPNSPFAEKAQKAADALPAPQN